MISIKVSTAFLAVLFASHAPAAVIFSNITSPINSGFSYGTPAGLEFTVTGGNYLLTDVEAQLWNQNSSSVPVSFSIYSDSSGPGTLLTTLSGTLPGNSNEVITSGAPSTSLVLQSGTSYWLVLDLSGYAWDGNASSNQPLSEYSSGMWYAEPAIGLQFAIDGTATAPEPGTIATAAIGIGLFALSKKLH